MSEIDLTRLHTPFDDISGASTASCGQRWVALIFICVSCFGGYFAIDVLPPMQMELMTDLHLDEFLYTGLYLAFNLSYCIFSLFGGSLVDKTTNRFASIVFVATSFLGTGLIYIGSLFNLYWLFVVGRIFVGCGVGNSVIVRNYATSLFFAGKKEVTFAFGFSLSFSRLGSVINLFLSPILVSIIGYKNVLLISFLLCGMSLAAVVVYFFLERNASNKNLIHTNKPKGNEKPFKLRDISKFPLQFWLLVIVTPLLYATVNSIISVIVDFLKTQYDFSSFTAGLHSSIIYLVSLVGCALSGAAVDKIGLRLTMLIISCVLLIAFVSLLAYTSVLPFIPLLLGGISYSIFASLIWSLIPVLLPQASAGTGNSLVSCSFMLLCAISSPILGIMVREMGYRSSLMYFLSISCICLALLLIMKWLDDNNGGKFDERKCNFLCKQKRMKVESTSLNIDWKE
ncbi:putative sodium glucose transporter [Monocercomonoides exilis]|uniref:putative sodium glucose transporter n=1 Tax=Monocercomonoides exilis TaxID=2049356 RepID=UPI0035594EAA|nr:putative sodium glucose transporter [Monocercomonoides exilis]